MSKLISTGGAVKRGSLALFVKYAFLPAVVSSLIYLMCLGYRRDYVGHYLAGYGGTLGLITVLVAVFPDERFRRDARLIVVQGCLLCVALGAFFEATAFRIAKFDEVDFCNQSLGAIVAAMSALHLFAESKPPLQTLNSYAVWATAALLLRADLSASGFDGCSPRPSDATAKRR